MKDKTEKLERLELQKFISNKISEIKTFEPNDYLKVILILKEVKDKYQIFEPKEYMPEMKMAYFIKSKPLKISLIELDINQLENKDSAFLAKNFIQTKILLDLLFVSIDF